MIMLGAWRPRIRISAADPDFFQPLYRSFHPGIQLPGNEGGRLNLRRAPNLKMSEATSALPTYSNGVHSKKFNYNPGPSAGIMLA
jgi:hypothetical protein